MDVLVTGGSGTIGSFVVDELIARDHDVSVFDADEPSQNVSYIPGDITEKSLVDEAIDGKDAVVHMIALTSQSGEKESPLKATEVNIGGTVNVLEGVRNHDARPINVSSKAVYGTLPARCTHPIYQPVGEDLPKDPTEVYGITKLTAEQYCRTYADRYDVDVASVRFASTFGPNKGDHDNSTISRLIECASQGGEVTVSGGDQKEDFIYFADIAFGIAKAIETRELRYPSYNLGTGSLATLNTFADALAGLCPGAEIHVSGGLNFYDHPAPRYCQLDISRAQADLGFEPRFTITEAVQDYLSRLDD